MSVAVLLGATGLIGRHLRQLLYQSNYYQKVIEVGRRPSTDNTKDFVKVDFEQLARDANVFACHDLFICLGTTIKKAGSQKQFRKVDYDYVLQACSLARSRGCKRVFVVSSIGADPDSKAFYFKVKGELEQSISALGFESVHIFRPTLLLGKRDQDNRFLEQLSGPLLKFLSPAMIGPLKRLRPIDAARVAEKMLGAATQTFKSSGAVVIHELTG